MEHLNFIHKLFDFSLIKVQMSAFYGALFSVIGVIVNIFCGFAQNYLGISATLFLLLFIVMITDYITGLKACRKEGGKFQSKKGLSWVFKFGSYMVFIAISFVIRKDMVGCGLTWIEIPMVLIHYFILVHILIWETKSVDENFERLGYSFRVLKLFDQIFEKISGLLRKKIDEQ